MSEKKKYKEKAKYVGDQIIELSKSTKRKPGYIKVVVPDELVQKLIEDQIKFYSPTHEFNVTALMLTWSEK